MVTSGNQSGTTLLVGNPGAVPACAAAAASSFRFVDSITGVLRLLRNEPAITAVLLAPSEDFDAYLELCRNIKFDRNSAVVAVLFIVNDAQLDSSADAFDAGADDCIRATATPRELTQRLTRALHATKAAAFADDADAVIRALANAIEGKDHYTCGHVERVGSYAVEIGRHVGLSADDLSALRVGGVVHDIGKVGIPDEVLNKKGKLTDEEMQTMRRHPQIGYEILKPLRTFRHVLPIVRWHHEKPNGRGYPDGIGGDELPLLARIIAVADVFDAISTARPYRAPHSFEECRRIMLATAMDGELDTELVNVLLEILEQSPTKPNATAA